ncbi:MAG: hypothetical protein ACI9OJ_000568 [Myxococcota bacterium]|jgi:hypothetical protein
MRERLESTKRDFREDRRRRDVLARMDALSYELANDPQQVGAWLAQLEGESALDELTLGEVYDRLSSTRGVQFAETAFSASKEPADAAGDRDVRTQALLGRLVEGLGLANRPEVRVDADAARRTQARGATGLMDRGVVYLDPARYNPESKDGQYVLAHEVTHAAQRELDPGKAAGPTGHQAAEFEASVLGQRFATRGEISAPTVALAPMRAAADAEGPVIPGGARIDDIIWPHQLEHGEDRSAMIESDEPQVEHLRDVESQVTAEQDKDKKAPGDEQTEPRQDADQELDPTTGKPGKTAGAAGPDKKKSKKGAEALGESAQGSKKNSKAGATQTKGGQNSKGGGQAMPVVPGGPGAGVVEAIAPPPRQGFRGEAESLGRLSTDLGAESQITSAQPMAVSYAGTPLAASEQLLAVAGQNPATFLEAGFQQSEEATALGSFRTDNAALAEAAAGLRTFAEDPTQHLGVNPVPQPEPYGITGFNLESVQGILQQVGGFCGTAADIVGIIALATRVAGWVLSVLAPPVGAALLVISNFTTLVEVILNVIAASCSGINAVIDIVRLCTTDDPKLRMQYATRFADNTLSAIGRGAVALTAGAGGGVQHGRAAFQTIRTSVRAGGGAMRAGAGTMLRGAGRGALTSVSSLRHVGGGLVRGGIHATRGVGSQMIRAGGALRRGMGTAARSAQIGGGVARRGMRAGGATALRSARAGAGTALRGTRAGGGQALRGIRHGGGQVLQGMRRGRAGMSNMRGGFQTMGRGMRSGGRIAGHAIATGGRMARGGLASGGRIASGGIRTGRQIAAGGRRTGRFIAGVGRGSRRAASGRAIREGGAMVRKGARSTGAAMGRGMARSGDELASGGRQFGQGARNSMSELSRPTAGPLGAHMTRMYAAQGFRERMGVFWADQASTLVRPGAGAGRLHRAWMANRNFWGHANAGLGLVDDVDDLTQWLPALANAVQTGDFHGASQAYLNDLDLNTQDGGPDESAMGAAYQMKDQALLAMELIGADSDTSPFGISFRSGDADSRSEFGALKGAAQHLLRDDPSWNAGTNAAWNQQAGAARDGAVADNRGTLEGINSSAGGGARDAMANLPGPQTTGPQVGADPQRQADAPQQRAPQRAPAGPSGDVSARIARMTSIARQMEVYETQLDNLFAEQQAYETSRQRLERLNSLPVPTAPQPAAASMIPQLDEDIAALTQTEADALAAKTVFQANVERHTQRSEDAQTYIDDARTRRASLVGEQTAAAREGGDIEQGLGGLDRGDQEAERAAAEGERGKQSGDATKAEVDGTELESQAEPEQEDVPWYRIDKHAANLARSAWRATVGRAMRYIGERFASIKAQLMNMLIEFALGMAGADDLKQQFRDARAQADLNKEANQQTGDTHQATDQALTEQQTTGAETLTEAQETAQGYADLVVEADETIAMAVERREAAELWKAEVVAYTAGFAESYTASFEGADEAQGAQWGQQDPSPTITAIDGQLSALTDEYDGIEQSLANEPAPEAQAPEMQGTGGAGPETMMPGPMTPAPMMPGPEMGSMMQGREQSQVMPEPMAPSSVGPEQAPPSSAPPANLMQQSPEVDNTETREQDAPPATGQLSPEVNDAIAHIRRTTDSADRALTIGAQRISRTLDQWHGALGQGGLDMTGLDAAPLATYEARIGPARQLIALIRSDTGAASMGDMAAIERLAGVDMVLREIANALQQIVESVLTAVQQGYDGEMKNIEGGQPQSAAAGGTATP